ncbi:YchO/YchP family invasin [Tatumella terrea]|uniref:YchO/YchP family invasin n=1 Tax=Tatumella terrea TaxID=419007 RepID=UPI0031E0DF9F
MPLNRSRILCCFVTLLLAAHVTARADSDTTLSETPFDDAAARFAKQADQLPELGSSAGSNDFSRQLAEIVQGIAAANDSDTDTSLGHSAGLWAFDHFRDQLGKRLNQESQSLLSPYGHASVNLNVDVDGNFDGTSASLLSPLAENDRYLTFSEVVLSESTPGTTGSVGLGQRWGQGNWLFGYNAFLDHLFNKQLNRASVGSEAWGDFLRFSANYYQPLSGWRDVNDTQMARMARGYDISSQGYLPFYRQLGVTVSWQQYLGDNIDAFDSGNYYHNPSALSLGVSYTPVPLVTFSASHKTGTGGESQDLFGLKLNYHFGESLREQLSPDAVAAARSLRGSRFDVVSRNNSPVLSYRKRSSLSVFLATPPWQLSAGESLVLKLQVTPDKNIKSVHWEGDTRALSLTPPADASGTQGWSIIMPAWSNDRGATNEYHLAVTVTNNHNTATSNTITLKLTPPMQLDDTVNPDQYDLMAP